MAKDCCGYCPVPVTEEEKEIAAEEEKVFVSGKISFMKDDPGRMAGDNDRIAAAVASLITGSGNRFVQSAH